MAVRKSETCQKDISSLGSEFQRVRQVANSFTPLALQLQPFPAAVLLCLSGVQLPSPHCQIPCPTPLTACMTYIP